MNPTFSVIIPVYNRATQIRPALESLVNQSYGDFECIIVDDGSDDSAALGALVDNFRDSRFRCLRRSNGGGGAARNTGIESARGKYIAFLDSDDLFLPDKLAKAKTHMEMWGAEAIYSRAFVDRGVPGKRWIRPDRQIGPNEDMGEYLFVANQFIQTSTIVMGADAARLVMFDPALRKGQDLDFCVRAHAAGIRFKMVDEPLIVWVDSSEHGRTSRHVGTAAPKAWLAGHRSILTWRAVLGYRATVLAYYQSNWKFLVVIRDLILGVVFAGVPVKVAARQWLRYSLPRNIYRNMVNMIVRVRGA